MGQGLPLVGRERDLAGLQWIPNFTGQSQFIAQGLQYRLNAREAAGDENPADAFFVLSFKKSD